MMHARALRRRMGGVVRRLAVVSALTAALAGTAMPAMATTPPPLPCDVCHWGNGADVPSGATLKSGTQVQFGQLTTLTMQSDGNLVLRTQGEPSFVLWASGTYGHAGATATMQADGNFVIYDTNHKALWSTGTYFHAGAHFSLMEDRNLVVYDTHNKAIWQSGSNLKKTPLDLGGQVVTQLNSGATLYGTKSRLVMQADGNLVIYSQATGRVLWHSMTYYHPGAHLVTGTDRLAIYPAQGGAPLWTSPTGGHGQVVGIFQKDDNFVIYDELGDVLWATYTNYAV
ncbi:hypothetical protein [Kitasatospora acidiphila]|uniref:hypothetical protein n=1 Tax=Kitasatospora acidiphila TaxID=2567942 RepID=UPI003C71228F